MPWKPPPAVLCRRSGKRVYPADNPVKIGGMVFLPGHFTCAKTGVRLNDRNAVVFDGDVYHKDHVPKLTHTVVVDNPEANRLKKQSVRQSKVAYKAKFEQEKGAVTSVAETPESMQVKKQMQMQSQVAYQTANTSEYTPVADDAATVAAAKSQSGASGVAYAQAAPPPEEAAPAAEAAAPPAAVAPPAAAPEPEAPPAAPEPAPPAAGGDVWVAEYDYTAADEDELTFVEGDKFTSWEEVDEGWSKVTNANGDRGMVPANYIVKSEGDAAALPAAEPEPVAEPEPEPEAEPEAPAPAEPEPAAEAPAEAVQRWKAEYDYTAADSDELSFVEGDVFINIKTVDEGWSEATLEKTGESGMVPANYYVEM